MLGFWITRHRRGSKRDSQGAQPDDSRGRGASCNHFMALSLEVHAVMGPNGDSEVEEAKASSSLWKMLRRHFPERNNT